MTIMINSLPSRQGLVGSIINVIDMIMIMITIMIIVVVAVGKWLVYGGAWEADAKPLCDAVEAVPLITESCGVNVEQRSCCPDRRQDQEICVVV